MVLTCVLLGSSTTAAIVSDDMTHGIIDRFSRRLEPWVALWWCGGIVLTCVVVSSVLFKGRTA